MGNRWKHKTLADRFWEKVDKSPGLGPKGECWLWRGSPRGNRKSRLSDTFYGGFNYNGKIMLAHRVAYILTHGELADEVSLRHDCDTPGCVRPEHLLPGDQVDNMRDCRDKGRNADILRRLGQSKHPRPRGTQHGMSKLDEHRVREIRAKFMEGNITKVALGRAYGVTYQAVGSILNGRTWKWCV